MPRVQAVFDWIVLFQFPVRMTGYYLQSTPNLGLSSLDLKARQARESKSLKSFGLIKKRITTLQECTAWLYSEHAAYAPDGRAEQLTDDVLELLLGRSIHQA